MALPRCGQSKHFACPCARRVLGERPAQKDCRFLLRVRCPPTAFPAAPSPRTETSARPVSKSSSKQDYTIQRPSKRPHIGRGAAQTIRPKPVTPMSESGSNSEVGARRREVRFAPKNRHRRTRWPSLHPADLSRDGPDPEDLFVRQVRRACYSGSWCTVPRLEGSRSSA